MIWMWIMLWNKFRAKGRGFVLVFPRVHAVMELNDGRMWGWREPCGQRIGGKVWSESNQVAQSRARNLIKMNDQWKLICYRKFVLIWYIRNWLTGRDVSMVWLLLNIGTVSTSVQHQMGNLGSYWWHCGHWQDLPIFVFEVVGAL